MAFVDREGLWAHMHPTPSLPFPLLSSASRSRGRNLHTYKLQPIRKNLDSEAPRREEKRRGEERRGRDSYLAVGGGGIMGSSVIVAGFVLGVCMTCCFMWAGAGEISDEISEQVLDVEAAIETLSPRTYYENENEEKEWSDKYSRVEEEEKEKEDEEEEEGPSVVVKIIHRDAMSKSSGRRHTVTEIVEQRLKRDAGRVEWINGRVEMATRMRRNGKGNWSQQVFQKEFSSSIISGLSEGSGEYFTRVGVGRPPRYSYMVLDTGSDIIWLQCLPCTRCYHQTDPLFNPLASSTYRKVPCATPLCKRLDVSGCSSGSGNNNNLQYCEYQVSYGDGSFTVGDLARETLTFRGTMVRNVALGCGHDNEGLFIGAAGLLGLGRGGLSFPSQAASRFSNKFSYCLVDRDAAGPASSSSSLIFGPSALPRSAVFTPLLSNPKLATFYYVQVSGISVGGKRLSSIPSSVFRVDGSGNGGVIIDSGTSVTRLVESAYVSMRDAFRAGTRRLKSAPAFSLFDTCYDLSGLTTVKVPTLVFHFDDRAAHPSLSLSLPANNYLIPVDTSGVFCFAFAATTSLSIIGNIQQQGFRVAFDLQSKRVGFAAASC